MKGEKAFPYDFGKTQGVSTGMSLRDYFAGQVITGLLAIGKVIESDGVKIHKASEYAELAYNISDAMLIERDKQ